MAARQRANLRLPPEVNRALYVRNLPFKITSEEMYDIFGKFGAIRQIRLGNAQDTRGTAFVVYEDIYDAKTAVDHLSGFNVCGRYLVVLYYQQTKMQKRLDTCARAHALTRSARGDARRPCTRAPTVTPVARVAVARWPCQPPALRRARTARVAGNER